jgi:hypothetical protein
MMIDRRVEMGYFYHYLIGFKGMQNQRETPNDKVKNPNLCDTCESSCTFKLESNSLLFETCAQESHLEEVSTNPFETHIYISLK